MVILRSATRSLHKGVRGINSIGWRGGSLLLVIGTLVFAPIVGIGTVRILRGNLIGGGILLLPVLAVGVSLVIPWREAALMIFMLISIFHRGITYNWSIERISANDVVLLLDAFAGILFVLSLFSGEWKRRKLDMVDASMVIMLLSATLSYLLHPLSLTLFVLNIRMFLRGFLLYWGVSRLKWRLGTLRRVVVVTIIIGALQIGVGLWQYLTICLPGNGDTIDALLGTFGESGTTMVGWYLLYSFSMIYSLFGRVKEKRWIVVAFGFLSLLTLWLGSSLLGFLLLLLVPVVGILNQSIRIRARFLIMAGMFVGIFLILVYGIYFEPTTPFATTYLPLYGGGMDLRGFTSYLHFALTDVTSRTSRMSSLLLSWHLATRQGILLTFILGNGPGALYTGRIVSTIGPLALAFPWPRYPFLWALDFQRTLVEWGLFGVLSLSFVMIALLRWALRLHEQLRDRFWSAVAFGFFITCVLTLVELPYQGPFTWPVIAYTFWLIAGILRVVEAQGTLFVAERGIEQ